MKPLLPALVVFALLSPVLAQQAAEAPPQPAGMTQAEAQAAAQQADRVDQAPAEPQDPATVQEPQIPAAPDTPAAPPAPDAAPQPPAPQEVQDADEPPVPPSTPPERVRRRAMRPAPWMKPLATAADYPVSQKQAQLSIGARLLSPAEVEQKFATPLKDYIVVEVGLYPVTAEGPLSLRLEDFTLRLGSENQAFFPEDPRDVAEVVSPGYGPPRRDVAVYPSVGVGYERGPWGHGVSTGVGVGVGVGGPGYPRGGVHSGRRVVEQELSDKALPLSSLTQPVAGYLYFPVKPKRNVKYALELNRGGEVISLALPPAKK